MTGIDDLVGEMYKSDAQYLVEAGCRDIRRSFEGNPFNREGNFKKGEAKLRESHQRGKINLTPLVEYGYELLGIGNSGNDAYRVLGLARELGAVIDQEKIRRNAYDSITNGGTERLELMEKHLSIKPDPKEILAYVHLNFQHHMQGNGPEQFWPRSFDALFYAVSKGCKVYIYQLPDKEIIEKVIQYELELPQNKRRALEHLRGFEKLGLRLATSETMAKLERIAELEG